MHRSRLRDSFSRQFITSKNGRLAATTALLGAFVLVSACDSSTASVEPRFGYDFATSGVTVNVRDFGALGDSVSDDTDAFARAIASLGASGGTVTVPRGRYRINPSLSIRLANNTSLILATDAVIEAIPVTARSSSVILISGVSNVRVVGGTIIGERVGHLGSTGEWGMGIRIVGASNIVVDGVTIQDCWGDGLYIGALGVTGESRSVSISHVSSRNNRRQGLSVTGALGVLVEDSDFSDTNGTEPQSGIDLEPDAGFYVTNVVIRRTTAQGNVGWGLIMNGENVTDVRVDSSSFRNNGREGLTLWRASQVYLGGNVFDANQSAGIRLWRASQNEIVSNSFRDNNRGLPPLDASFVLSDGSSRNIIQSNRFTSDNAPHDIAIMTRDCTHNTIISNTLRSLTRPESAINDQGSNTVIEQPPAAKRQRPKTPDRDQ